MKKTDKGNRERGLKDILRQIALSDKSCLLGKKKHTSGIYSLFIRFQFCSIYEVSAGNLSVAVISSQSRDFISIKNLTHDEGQT